jgi:hypothetical protein
MSSKGIIFVLNFVKISELVPKLKRDTDRQRQTDSTVISIRCVSPAHNDMTALCHTQHREYTELDTKLTISETNNIPIFMKMQVFGVLSTHIYIFIYYINSWVRGSHIRVNAVPDMVSQIIIIAVGMRLNIPIKYVQSVRVTDICLI